MVKKILLALSIFVFTEKVFSQTNQQLGLVSGPMLGNLQHRTASIWIETDPNVSVAEIRYFPADTPAHIFKSMAGNLFSSGFNPITFTLTALEPGVRYNYEIWINQKKLSFDYPLTFKTRELWEYRKQAPAFSFLCGSCMYINDSIYDRPGKPYGQSTKILKTMASDTADFNIWDGDNLYFREVDYSSPWGMAYRYHHDRAVPDLQPLLARMPQYAIWDDHDYGPNDADKSFTLKNESLNLSEKYWMNPTYGQHESSGNYTSFSWSDCDFFLTDSRWFRANDDYPDSLNGKPNPEKTFFGTEQMNWLENALLYSNATFKFIVSGSQVLNEMNHSECLNAYTFEYNQLMDFIRDNKISGVVFLTGDRHFSELIVQKNNTTYPLYDFTCSPLTSSPYAGVTKTAEANNPQRVPNCLAAVNNYGKISVSGAKGERKLTFACYDEKKTLLFSYSVNAVDLKAH